MWSHDEEHVSSCSTYDTPKRTGSKSQHLAPKQRSTGLGLLFMEEGKRSTDAERESVMSVAR
jgi:hypothetical protein